MFARPAYPRSAYHSIRAIDRTLRSLEHRLQGARLRVFPRAVQGANQVAETIASTLDQIADRVRNGAFGDDAERIRAEAMKLGDVTLRRLSREIQSRPLVTLAIAVGFGLLVGALSQRRS